DHDTLETQLCHATLELLRGVGWILQRNTSKSAKPIGMFLDLRREKIVDLTRACDGFRRVYNALNAGNRERKTCHIDSARIHSSQALLAELDESAADHVQPSLVVIHRAHYVP